MLTLGSLFSGIGGIDLAFQYAGFEIAYQVEIDVYCQKVLTQHWPEVQRYSDIFTVDADTLPATDVITAGFPCQPFSVAGNQRGEDDERFLWPEIVRLVRAKRPRVVFLENVPGLRTNDSGRTFKRILRELAEIGYDAQWHHLRASDVGAPHRRERLFIVAYTTNCGVDRGQRFQRDDAIGGNPNGEHNRIVPDGGNELMAYTEQQSLEGRSIAGLQTDNHVAKREATQDCLSAVGYTGSGMGNPQCTNLERARQSKRPIRTASVGYRKANPTRNAGRGQVESRLGRDFARLPCRLDRHQFPAPRGPQYDWEPARTTTQTENRTARIKALGNAVVPQVIYPIALAIYEYMQEGA